MSAPALIPLLANDGSVRAYALVDPADVEFVNRWTWRLSKSGYAVRFDTSRNQTAYLHRELLKPEPSLVVDHINRNKLDNRRENLRSLTPSQSNHNMPAQRSSSSPHRGVCWDTRAGRWLASAQKDRRHVHLGHFDDEDEAARAAARWRAEHMEFSDEAAA